MIYGAVKDGFPKYEFRTIPIDKSYPTNLITISSLTKTKLHPSEKPVALMEYLIKTYTNAGDIVLDNAYGSCTTGVACVNLNRSFIGIEKDEKYFNMGVERVRKQQSINTISQISMEM